jgi:hypothetical protein
MKRKLWFAGILGCTLFGVAAQQSWAFFGCHSCCGCNKYSTYICCRPYNAFTPVCFGAICCQGCCPLQTCAPPSCGYSPCCAPPAFCPGCMAGSGYPPMAGGGWPAPMYAAAPYMASPEPPMIPPPSPPPPGYGYPPPPAHGYGYPPGPGPGYAPPAPAPAPGYTPPAPTPIPHQTGYGPANGYYPGFWPNYPVGYWTNMYAPQGYWGTGY